MRPTTLYLTTVSLMLLLLPACGDDKPTNVPPSAPATKASEPSTEAQSTSQVQQSETAPMQQPETMPTPTTTQIPAKTETTAESVSNDPNSEGLNLAKKSGCLACHAINKKVVGPPWKDVAKRYADDPGAKAKLIEKISKGGRGNWTDLIGNVAMPPYSPRVSAENIENLVDFVLGLPID